MMTAHSKLKAPGRTAVEKDVIPANPLLPKQVATEPKQPPQCPLKDI